jgi:hypothetical protein
MGAAAPHCELPVQATHVLFAPQNGCPGTPLQSVSARQPTHAPLSGSHLGKRPPQLVALHFAVHVWLTGEHAGEAAGQSALPAQT